MAIDNEALLAAIEDGRSNSYGTDEQSELGQARAEALEAFLGMNTIPAPMGRSQVVDRSVYETISTLMPSLVRIFAGSSDEVCKFTPVGPEDEGAAEQTTAVVAHVVTQLNPWEQICGDWIFDALIGCNGYAMPYWHESDELVRESYDGQSDDQVAAILSDEGVTVIQHTETVDKEATKEAQEAYAQAMQQWQMGMQQYQMAAMQAQQSGQQIPPPPPQPKPPQPVMTHDLVIERKATEGKVCIKVLAPEHCKVHVSTPDWTLQDCPFFEYGQRKTIAELRGMGFDVPEDISDDELEDGPETIARDRFDEDDQFADGKGVLREVWVSMIWVRADAEGDGMRRLYYVVLVGNTILYAEPCGRIPVASMTPQPMPHRHIGMSVAETVMDIQRIKTAVKRGALDDLYQSVNQRFAISDKVNMADFLNSAPGAPVRLVDGAMPGEGHIIPLGGVSKFDTVIGSLEYFDQERQNRTGVMRGAAGLEANAMNRAAVGTTVAMQSHSAMRTEHIARTMATAVETLFDIVHELISKHRNKALTLKLQGKWVTVDPQAWRTKRDVRISVGVGAGNKESMMQQLGNVLGAQMQVGLPMGLVGRDNIRATNVEILKLAGFANPDKFWPDPQTLPPQQPQPSPEQVKAQAQMQLEQFKAQQDQQKFQAEQQIEVQRLQLQAQVDAQREEMQARQKQLELQQQAELQRQDAYQQFKLEQLKLQMEQWRASLEASVKLEIADKSAQTTMDTAQISKAPDTRVDKLIETIRRLEEEASQPAEIIRGPDGKAVGFKKGGRERKIVRGPDGRAIGVQ